MVSRTRCSYWAWHGVDVVTAMTSSLNLACQRSDHTTSLELHCKRAGLNPSIGPDLAKWLLLQLNERVDPVTRAGVDERRELSIPLAD